LIICIQNKIDINGQYSTIIRCNSAKMMSQGGFNRLVTEYD